MNAILKEYNKLEDINDHNGAAKLLIMKFGTKDEMKIMNEIIDRHKAQGFMTPEDIKLRYKLSQKYYKIISKN
jgi:hypothetical protein